MTAFNLFFLILLLVFPSPTWQQLHDYSCVDTTVPITLSFFLDDEAYDIGFFLTSPDGEELANVPLDTTHLNGFSLLYKTLFVQPSIPYNFTIVDESEDRLNDGYHYRIYSGRELWRDRLLLEGESGNFSSRTHMVQAPPAIEPFVVTPPNNESELVNISVVIMLDWYNEVDMIAWRIESPDGQRIFAYAPPGTYYGQMLINATEIVGLPVGEYRFVKTLTYDAPYEIRNANQDLIAEGLDEEALFSVLQVPVAVPTAPPTPAFTPPPTSSGNTVPVTLAIQMDDYATEISWQIFLESDGSLVAEKAYFEGDNNMLVTEVLFLVPDVEYRLIMFDSFGDGLEDGHFALYYGIDTQSPVILRDNFDGDREERVFVAALPPPTPAPTVSPFAGILVLLEIPGFYDLRLESLGTSYFLEEGNVDFGAAVFSDVPKNQMYRFSLSNTSCCNGGSHYYDGYIGTEDSSSTVDSRLFSGQEFRFRKDHYFFLGAERPNAAPSRVGTTPVTVEIVLDRHPQDAAFQLLSADGNVLYADIPRGLYSNALETVHETVHVPPNSDYFLVISDESHEDTILYRVIQGTDASGVVLWSGSVNGDLESEIYSITVGSGPDSPITTPLSVQFQLIDELGWSSSSSNPYYADREDDVKWEIATIEDGQVHARGVFEILSFSIRTEELVSYPVEGLSPGVPYVFRIQWKEMNYTQDKVDTIMPYDGLFLYEVVYNDPEMEGSLPLSGLLEVAPFGEEILSAEHEFLIIDPSVETTSLSPLPVAVSFPLDAHPEETSWSIEVLDYGDFVFDAPRGTYIEAYGEVKKTLLLVPQRIYRLSMMDSLADGIECIDEFVSPQEPLLVVYHAVDGGVGPIILTGGNCTDRFDILTFQFYVSADPEDVSFVVPTDAPTSLPSTCTSLTPEASTVPLTIVIGLDYWAHELAWYLETFDGNTNLTSVEAGTYAEESNGEVVTNLVMVENGAQFRLVIFGESGYKTYAVYFGDCSEPSRLLIREGKERWNHPERVERPFTALPPSSGELATITLEITLDQFPEKTGWEITDPDGRTVHMVYSGSYVGCRGVKKSHTLVVKSLRQYEFQLIGEICCAFGKGHYEIYQGSDNQGPLLVSSRDRENTFHQTSSFFVHNSSETINTQSPTYAPSSQQVQRTPSPVVPIDPTKESNVPLTFEVLLDAHPNEFGWQIVSNDRSSTYVSVPPGSYISKDALEFQSVLLPGGAAYILMVEDTGRDGLCCEYGRGFFSLFYETSQGERYTIVSGGSERGFAMQEMPFTLPSVNGQSGARRVPSMLPNVMALLTFLVVVTSS